MSRLHKIKWILRLDMLILIIVLNAFSWLSPAFTDFYVAKVFPLWVASYGRFSELFSFSLGEGMILLLLLLLCLVVLFVIPAIVLRHKTRFFRIFYLNLCKLVLPVTLIMTLNCTVLYHTTKLTVVPSTKAASAKEEESSGESLEELIDLYNRLVERANELSLEMERDGKGYVNQEAGTELFETAISSMQKLGETYPLLKGYYPQTKVIRNSWFLSQQYIAGYYFPFSMESNINGVMYIMNVPATVCHELAHIHGYIREDEANFLGFAACVESGNEFFEYSGILSVLSYVASDIRKNLTGQEKFDIVTPNDLVVRDSVFLTEEAWQQVEEESALDTETVNKATDAAMNESLKINGVSNGMESYSDVVQFLLEYY